MIKKNYLVCHLFMLLTGKMNLDSFAEKRLDLL